MDNIFDLGLTVEHIEYLNATNTRACLNDFCGGVNVNWCTNYVSCDSTVNMQNCAHDRCR